MILTMKMTMITTYMLNLKIIKSNLILLIMLELIIIRTIGMINMIKVVLLKKRKILSLIDKTNNYTLYDEDDNIDIIDR
jgi:hypothetical protein